MMLSKGSLKQAWKREIFGNWGTSTYTLKLRLKWAEQDNRPLKPPQTHKFGVPYFGVLIIRILLFRVLY